MEELGVRIMQYRVERYVEIVVGREVDGWAVRVGGVDERRGNFSFVKGVRVVVVGGSGKGRSDSGEPEVDEE